METSLRILDADANRVREALRTLEDVVRFQFDDHLWSGVLKEFRHDFTAAVAGIPPADLLAARDTPGDVGTQITTSAEGVRPDQKAIMAAACKRMQEALRSMEEQAKTLHLGPGTRETAAHDRKLADRGRSALQLEPGSANPAVGLAGPGLIRDPGVVSLPRQLEALRYRAYDLEAKLIGRLHRGGRLQAARLYVLLTSTLCRKPWQEVARAVLEAGTDVLQLREKNTLSDRELLARCGWLKERCHEAGKLFIVNDRPDIAALAGADGVHLGQDDLPVVAARKIVGGSSLIGVSTHNVEQARQAALAGADYLGVGPMFVTTTKPQAAKQWGIPGPELLRQVTAEISLPLVAIGGIGADNAASIVAAGGRCLAVSSAVISADDPAGMVREIRRKIGVGR